MLKGRCFLFLGALLLVGTLLWSSGSGITEEMTSLVLQIGVILFAARIGGIIMKKVK